MNKATVIRATFSLLPLTIGMLLGGATLPLTAFAAKAPPPPKTTYAIVGGSLNDFFTAALNNSPDLAVAREQWNVSSARKDQATGQILPQVSATAGVSNNNYTTNSTGLMTYRGENYAVGVNQVLFNWQAFLGRRQASLIENESEAQYYVTLANLLTQVADQYLQVLQAEDALRSVNSELGAITNQLKQVQTQYNLKLARITDLYATQARVASTQADKVVIESQVTINRENLRATTGIDVGALRRLPDTLQIEPMQETLELWLQRTRTNNKDLVAHQLALQAADKQVSATRGTYLPQVSLAYQYQDTNLGFNNQLLSERTTSNYVGINVVVPIFAGGSNRARVREAFSMRDIAESQLRQTEIEVLAHTRTSFAQAKTGESRVTAGEALAESTATAYTAMQRGYELGTVTTVDVLNALRDRFAAERDLQRARYDLIRARLTLRRDSGSLTADDIRDVNNLLTAEPR
jgi:outer membrane protein